MTVKIGIVKVGDKVTCTEGHVICEVIADPWTTLPWSDAFGVWRQKDRPRRGEMYKPKCAVCGADFIHPGPNWAMHFQDGRWKP